MDGPSALTTAAEAAEQALRGGLADAAGAPQCRGTVAEWVASLAGLQRVVDIASAAQDLALARLAAIEVEVAEDGTLVERHRAPGHVSLDAPPLASGALTTTAAHAERRVRSAVRLAADGPAGSATATGLGALHEAMADGRLDAYRADVLATELEDTPAEVAATVVASLEPYLATETGTELRRRCRRLLARISPDLLSQRARRARSDSRLERWASEPGVDTWHGTFPSEEAVHAWAAVDALAQRYVAEGTCERIDRARAKALTDLVTGRATIETHLVLTVPDDVVDPAGAGPDSGGPAATTTTRSTTDSRHAASTSKTATSQEAQVTIRSSGARDDVHRTPAPDEAVARAHSAPHPDDLVEIPGPRPSTPLLVPRGWLAGLAREGARAARGAGTSRRRRRAARVQRCHPVTGALLPAPDPTGRTREDRIPTPDAADPGSEPSTQRTSQPDAQRTSQPDAQPRSQPATRLGSGPGSGSATQSRSHADTQPRSQPATRLGSGSGPRADPGPYRPDSSLAELVGARDAHCRFPGCHVSARFCDLDHVRPWPHGPTSPDNLICLCRRHHRTKQRPGWRVRLAADGIVTWTDPTGRVRTTEPPDLLHAAVLPHRADEPPATGHSPRLVLPDGPHSFLEHALEHLPVRRLVVHAGYRHDRHRAVSNPDHDEPPF